MHAIPMSAPFSLFRSLHSRSLFLSLPQCCCRISCCQTLKGSDWKKAALLTATLYPSVVFGTGFFLNFFI